MAYKRQSHRDYVLCNNLRSRLAHAVRRGSKTCSAVDGLGCSLSEFREWIASKWQPGMSWDNYGEWHLDHVYPLALVNWDDPVDVALALHHSNYQPLWAKENCAKGRKAA